MYCRGEENFPLTPLGAFPHEIVFRQSVFALECEPNLVPRNACNKIGKGRTCGVGGQRRDARGYSRWVEFKRALNAGVIV
jgi:hypothetical protein